MQRCLLCLKSYLGDQSEQRLYSKRRTSPDELTVKEIISVYSNHPSIQKIKRVFNTDSKSDLPKPTASDINKITKSSDTNKATRQDGISAKFV